MKTLLAIISEPNESKAFIRYSLNLAKDLNRKAHFMYVQNPNMYPLGTPNESATAMEQIQLNIKRTGEIAKKTIWKYINELNAAVSSSLVLDVSSRVGVISNIANDLVKNNEADMVAIEGKEEDNIWSQAPGNVDVSANIECPVWFIPYGATYQSFNHIIYATDYKEDDVPNLKHLVNFTKAFKPKITALHITDNIDFHAKVQKSGFLDLIKEKTDYENLDVKVIGTNNNVSVAKMITDYAALIKANLIVVLKENKSFFEFIFTTDHAKQVMEKSLLPVLVYHEKED